MIVALLAASVAFAGGLWLLVAELWPAPPSLEEGLRRLNAPHSPVPLRTSGGQQPDRGAGGSIPVRIGRRLIESGDLGLVNDRAASDLAILHRSGDLYIGSVVTATIAGAVAGPFLWAVAMAAGTALPLVVPLWLLVSGGAIGFFVPRLTLHSEAEQARTDFRHALGAYLDVLVLLLAAQEGPEAAMEMAAKTGTGPAFSDLRRATLQARLSGVPVWEMLDRLGRELDVVELCEISAAGSLAGERGAAVRRSLIAKARALRSASSGLIEANARRRSQQMFLPLVLIGMGFVVFLLYPLVTTVQIG